MMSSKFIWIYLLIGWSTQTEVNLEKLKLKQVIILSRHNIRSSLATKLHRYTPKKWPQQSNLKPGYLTQKGAILESYMGSYFSEILQAYGLLSGECPGEDEVYVYANTISRTMETAKAFVKGAFKDCNVPVHSRGTTEIDPLFNPVIHDNSEEHKNAVKLEMEQIIKEAKLKDVYEELNKILDIKSSKICKEESICDLNEAKNEIDVKVGQEPTVYGPLTIGNSVLDFFLMNYYDGMPLEDIGWGHLRMMEAWKFLTKISRLDQYVRYNTTAAVKDIAGPLLKHMAKIFREDKTKVILLVGHDFNLNPVMHAMGFKPYKLPLPGQLEAIPIGSKLVFQKWTDGENDYLRVNYIYASGSQLRSGVKLSLKSGLKPQSLLMELKYCKSNQHGLCLWSEFVNNLQL